jgi:glycosyltransferase involved in cell wall biosynthesis
MHSKNPFMWRMTAMALAAIIRDQNIDIVHVRSRAPAFPARWAVLRANRRGRDVKLVTTYHGVYNAKSELKKKYNAVMTRGDAVIANSEYTRNHIVSEHGLPKDSIDAIPRGVDLTLFPLSVPPETIAQTRARWGVEDGARVLLLPGRLTRWKGQIDAIKAMKDINTLTLVIQGDAQGRDDYVAEMRALADNLPTGRVVFAAPHTDMAASYAASFGVIVPSNEPEAFGRVTAEASAMGKPVIAAAHGGAIEILDAYTPERALGLMATPGDIPSLSKQMKALAAMSDEDARNFAAPAMARARQYYTRKAMCEATLAVYERLLGK